MKLELNIHKKYFLILLGAVLLVAGGFVVYAQTSIPNPGHDVNQIGGFPTCASDEALTHTSSGWSCISVSSDGGSTGGGEGVPGQVHYAKLTLSFGNSQSVNTGFVPKEIIVRPAGTYTSSGNTYRFNDVLLINLTDSFVAYDVYSFNSLGGYSFANDLFEVRRLGEGYELKRNYLGGSGGNEFRIIAFG